ncbi:MFS transporter [Amycolatopsis sp. H20-H5]|uniref:MFS transporter n=1 Tax=Amycolatopsis sp. H20-H5 TaxID=3046309 RepID=UPI002DBC4FF9|nr:MFS transporter [Amycolatopsis sp. H20-H5]MEC3974445.1 MFS transporter [Amycolatopsis sp. H20-H5]
MDKAPPRREPRAFDGSSEVFRSHLGSLIAGCFAILLALAAPSLIGTITGSIAVKLQINGTELTWAVSVVWLGAAAAAYLSGTLADHFGRRRVLVVSAGVLAAGEAISGFAGSVPMLCAGQVLAGIGSGGLGAVSLAMVAAASRNSNRRPMYLAAFAGSLSAGPIVSALLGGFLATRNSFEGAFLGLAVVAMLGMVLIQTVGANSRAERPRSIDVRGQAILVVVLTALLFAVIQGSATRWGAPLVVSAFIVTVVAAFCFVLAEKRPAAMLDLSIFRIKAFSLAAILAVVSWFVSIGSAYLFSLRLAVAQGHSPQFTAMALILIGVVASIIGFACRPALARFAGVRALVVGGLLSFTVANLWLAWAPIENTSFALALGFVFFYAIGQVTTTAGVSAAAVNSVPAELESTAASTQETLRVVGPPLGIAILGAVTFARSAPAFQSRLGSLGLPPEVGHVVAEVNGHGGVLAVLGSGIGDKFPAVGQAASTALGEGIANGGYVGAVLAAIMAAIAAVFLRDNNHRAELPPHAAVVEPADRPASSHG